MRVGFEVPMPPRGKEAGRAVRTGFGVKVVKAEATRRWEALLADMAAARLPAEIMDGSLRVDILAVLPRPKRLLRPQDANGPLWCPAKPDEDNIRKAVKDALKAFWRDDAQVVWGETGKMYAEKTGRPRVYVSITDELPRPGEVLARFQGLVSVQPVLPA